MALCISHHKVVNFAQRPFNSHSSRGIARCSVYPLMPLRSVICPSAVHEVCLLLPASC